MVPRFLSRKIIPKFAREAAAPGLRTRTPASCPPPPPAAPQTYGNGQARSGHGPPLNFRSSASTPRQEPPGRIAPGHHPAAMAVPPCPRPPGGVSTVVAPCARVASAAAARSPPLPHEPLGQVRAVHSRWRRRLRHAEGAPHSAAIPARQRGKIERAISATGYHRLLALNTARTRNITPITMKIGKVTR